MSEQSISIIQSLPMGFWIALFLVIVVPVGIAVDLYLRFPEEEEDV